MGIGSRVDAHAVDLNGRSKINFPPRVVLACGMRGGFVVKVAIRVSINGKLGRSAVVCRALRCGFTNGDVLSAREHLDFGEHQEGCSPRLGDADKPCSLRSASGGLCWPGGKLFLCRLDAYIELRCKVAP